MRILHHLLLAALLAAAPGWAAPSRAKDPIEPARAALRALQFAKAMQLLQPLSQSNADARYLLGLIYLNGIGIAPDEARARTLLLAAAEQDQPQAAYVIAAQFARDNDSPRAKQWLERSAQLGYSRASAVLHSGHGLYEADPAGGMDPALLSAWASECARQNNAAEIKRLGKSAALARDGFDRTPLSHAAEAGALEAATALIEAGADVNAHDHLGVSALMLAAERADPAMLGFLLAHGADAASADAEGRTALFYAARKDNPAALRALLEANAGLDARDKRDYNALDAALAVGAAHSAEALSSAGARSTLKLVVSQRQTGRFDPAHPGEIYRAWPPLALAVARNDAAAVAQLIDAGADPKMRVPQGDPLLAVAIDARALATIKPLLARGADASSADHAGHGVLWLAAARGDANLVSSLLEAGVKADAHAGDEEAPLLGATRNSHREIVAQLLGAGAPVDPTDVLGRTPLMLAAASDAHALVEILLTHHASLTQKDKLGRTALWYGAQGGEASTALLLIAGADVAARDADGMGALHAAALKDNGEVIEALLKAHAALNARNRSGDSPLMVAAAAGHAQSVQALLQHSPELDLQNGGGDTALIAASRSGFSDTCRLLLSAGANRALRNRAGIAAADAAAGRGFPALAKNIADKS